ncbi:hypothetical protein L7F22_018112 [Adiantum nelumboides]|nr:hypothetical protein [Adiantum nelumboides]
MASVLLEEFVGNGVLKKSLPSLVDEGWDDVPTLKMMSAEDMDIHSLFNSKGTYLHDRSLMEYAEKLDVSSKGLPELLNLSPSTLSTQYGLKRGYVARIFDRAMACGIVMPPSLTPVSTSHRRSSFGLSKDLDSYKSSPNRPFSETTSSVKPFNSVSDVGRDKFVATVGSFKRIVAAIPLEPRFFGIISPFAVA